MNDLTQEKLRLNEIKIILIGDAKTGKTSLLRRLKDNTFDPKEAPTDGINIEVIPFGKCQTFKEQKAIHDITGHFWDFGGQEMMQATHQFFLTKRSIYVLVLHANNDANNATQIRHWIKQIRELGGESPIIVLANQLDMNPNFDFVNKRELQEEFPCIKSFINVSCKEGTNIDLFKYELADIISTSEMLKTEVDRRWIQVQNKLQEATKNNYFVNEARFLQLCNEVGLTERIEQREVIRFLHDTGQVLHFDDLNLSEYYVLNPYWLTYGAYQILTSKYAGEMKGVVRLDKLEYIINEEEDKKERYQPANYRKIKYSPNDRRFLIDILQVFKLCFRTPEGDRLIIPDLLDTTEPLTVTDPIRNAGQSIQFVYEYDYLPGSVMPNLMTETHPMMINCWRTGFVLRKDDCEALITNYKNRISITVTGERKMKRDFMAVIRYIIDSINDKLRNKPVRLIPLPGVNDYADYERLLMRQKNGKTDYLFDEDKPTEKRFSITELLEGIPSEDEVKTMFQKMDKFFVKSNSTPVNNVLTDYSNFLLEIKERIRKSQYAAAKTVNQEIILLYWDIGRRITEKQQMLGWGKSVVERLSKDLQNEFPGMPGYSARNIWYMQQFYSEYKDNSILQPLVAEISWSKHLVIMSKCKDVQERQFYILATKKFGWTKDVLVNQVELKAYERYLLNQTNFDMTLPEKIKNQAILAVKDEYNFGFTELADEHSEKDLELALIKNIRSFLLEMNYQFAFIGNQFKVQVDDKEYFIDLLLFHRQLRCLVAVELKIGEFLPEYKGKMEFYLSILNDKVKSQDEEDSIGIIICKEKNRNVVKYSLKTSNMPIGVATYSLSATLPEEYKKILPSPKEIADKLNSFLSNT